MNNATAEQPKYRTGRVVAIRGDIVDVRFPQPPPRRQELRIDYDDDVAIVLEVQSQPPTRGLDVVGGYDALTGAS